MLWRILLVGETNALPVRKIDNKHNTVHLQDITVTKY
jgi:hypothetical protein